MDCYMLDAKPEALWTIHLAIHPQVNLRNVNRRTYAHYVEDANGKSIKVHWEPVFSNWGYSNVSVYSNYFYLKINGSKKPVDSVETGYTNMVGGVE